MKLSKSEQLEEMLAPLVEKTGYECMDVTFEKAGKDWILTVYIGSPNGISLDDCEKVSQVLSPFLDETDPIEQSYFLEVSSPGIDRPLKKDRDYERAVGETIAVHLFAKRDGVKDFTGVLTSADSSQIVLETENGPIEIARKDISKAEPVIEF